MGRRKWGEERGGEERETERQRDRERENEERKQTEREGGVTRLLSMALKSRTRRRKRGTTRTPDSAHHSVTGRDWSNMTHAQLILPGSPSDWHVCWTWSVARNRPTQYGYDGSTPKRNSYLKYRRAIPRNVVTGSSFGLFAGIAVHSVMTISIKLSTSTANSAKISCISELMDGTPIAKR